MAEKRVARFALTMGDPAGIGPEVCVRALYKISAARRRMIVVIGDLSAFKSVKGAKVDFADYNRTKFPPPGRAAFLDMNALPKAGIAVGKISAACGRASASYIKKAVELCMAGNFRGVITAPINKKALSLAGVPYPGHTEMLAGLTGSDNVAMMMMSREMRVILLSTHLSLEEAIKAVNFESIAQKLELIHRYIPSTKAIAVCGLNPHASDGGIFGGEEKKIIAPAVKAAVEKGINAIGPLPADTVFAPHARKRYRAILAMYHDQGLVGIKAVSFGNCANVTLGLPFIRTSVDHGTAMDIVGKGRADPSSMVFAINSAFRSF
ncbi:MAG: 4-hydroxythreonine-4-phosphate dehydrogenase [bacterium]|nr:MAG: 4-hydroxythreonine-4-phosphate dehydrogenase [bacterium]